MLVLHVTWFSVLWRGMLTSHFEVHLIYGAYAQDHFSVKLLLFLCWVFQNVQVGNFILLPPII